MRIRVPDRRPLALAGTLLVTVFVAAVTASPASALVDVACVGTQSSSYAPGLTNRVQSTTIGVSGVLSPCLSLSDPSIRSGTYGSPVTRDTSCLELLNGGPGTRVFRWSTGRTSTFSFNSISNYVQGQIVVTLNGTITSGQFSGATVTQETVLVADLTRCGDPAGLTTANGLTTLAIVL